MQHATHKSQLTRLRRLHGQVAGLIRMVEDERYCVDLLTQTRAIHAALRAVEQAILKTHVRECVVSAVRNNNEPKREAKLEELFGVLSRFGK